LDWTIGNGSSLLWTALTESKAALHASEYGGAPHLLGLYVRFPTGYPAKALYTSLMFSSHRQEAVSNLPALLKERAKPHVALEHVQFAKYITNANGR
jgi:hypothetical protein